MTGQYYGGMEPEVLFRVRFLSDLTPGPGGLPLFVLTDILEGDPPRYRSRLALFDGGLRLLTQEEAKRPSFRAPFLYFLRRVGEGDELFRLDLRGGEAERLTETAGVLDYALGPGGEVAFLALKEPQKPGAPRVFEGWPFKMDGRGLLPEGNVALYALEDGKPRLLLDRYPAPKEMAYTRRPLPGHARGRPGPGRGPGHPLSPPGGAAGKGLRGRWAHLRPGVEPRGPLLPGARL